MKLRNLLVGFAGLLVIALVAVQSTGPSADAQDTTEQRLEAIETQVADLDARVTNYGREIERLEDKVAALEGGSEPAADAGSDGSAGQATTDGGIEITGSGDSAAGPIDVAAGAYTFAASCGDGIIFTVDITALESDEFVVSTLVGTPPYQGSEVLEFEGGRYAFSVTCGGAWSLTLTPLA
jgi:hypothetical protein